MPKRHHEGHYGNRVGWLRAAVLGANDGIVSTASLIIGVAAADASQSAIITAGVAGTVAGAMSMAAGEYVSVSSQADSERSDLERERREQEQAPDVEHAELAAIYVERGLEPLLADEVARQLMAHDALGSHARDELHYTEVRAAKPVQAALASAASFAVGAAAPLLAAALLAPTRLLPGGVALWSVLLLAGLGALAARIGGAPPLKGALRVSLWGLLAMAGTAAAGALFGLAV